MTNAPIRVGLIGFGLSGSTFHGPLIAAEPRLSMARVASGNPAKVLAAFPSAQVVPDPIAVATAGDVDLVVIASPNDTHEPLARAALEAGKHVVVDKPFTLNLADARALIALSDRKQRLLTVFQNRRWDSDYLSVRHAIQSGAIGKVRHFESHFERFRPQVPQRWQDGDGPGSGIWFGLGPHLVDQALQLFGLPDRVQASLAMMRNGAKTDDWAHVILEYPARRAVLHASMVMAGGSPRFTVHGDGGSLTKMISDRQEQQLLDGVKPGAPEWGRDDDPVILYDGSGQRRSIAATRGDQRQFYRGISASLLGEGSNPVPPVEALAVMAVIDAALESARQSRTMELDFSDRERALFARSSGDAAHDANY